MTRLWVAVIESRRPRRGGASRDIDERRDRAPVQVAARVERLRPDGHLDADLVGSALEEPEPEQLVERGREERLAQVRDQRLTLELVGVGHRPRTLPNPVIAIARRT